MLRNLYTTAAIVAALATAKSAQTRDRNSTRAGGDAGCAEQQRNNRATFCEERKPPSGAPIPSTSTPVTTAAFGFTAGPAATCR